MNSNPLGIPSLTPQKKLDFSLKWGAEWGAGSSLNTQHFDSAALFPAQSVIFACLGIEALQRSADGAIHQGWNVEC